MGAIFLPLRLDGSWAGLMAGKYHAMTVQDICKVDTNQWAAEKQKQKDKQFNGNNILTSSVGWELGWLDGW